MSDVCIYVVDHTGSDPIEEPPYRLLRVGDSPRDAPSGACKSADCDSVGENIACKNFAYSELTGLYWVWKNTDHDITGLMHYRRFLAAPGVDRPLDESEILEALQHHDLLVPRPSALKCSLEEQYCACHVTDDLAVLFEAMRNQPERYRMAFSEVMESNVIIPCNIMAARKDLLDEYCAWLFPVLGQCEENVDLFSGRDAYQMRVFGFLSERLLLVWIVANDIDCGFFDVLTRGSADDLRDSIVGDYDHSLAKGLDGLDESMLFDEDFYRGAYPDVRDAIPEGQSVKHYREHGIREGRLPSPAYFMEDYANVRPELRSKLGEMSEAYFEALEREVKRKSPIVPRNKVLGITKKGMTDYAPVYDWLYYTTRYDDVPNDYRKTEEALRHFIEVGIPEGRQGSKGFSLDAYKKAHPGLVRRFGDDNRRYYLHYALGEGRRRHPVDWRYTK